MIWSSLSPKDGLTVTELWAAVENQAVHMLEAYTEIAAAYEDPFDGSETPLCETMRSSE